MPRNNVSSMRKIMKTIALELPLVSAYSINTKHKYFQTQTRDPSLSTPHSLYVQMFQILKNI